MCIARLTRRSLLALAICAVCSTAVAQTKEPFTPTVGQPGKDVVWVPTSQSLVDKMLDMAELSASDTLFDLGSGDGRTVITAAKRGARAFGIEYDPDMVALSIKNAAEAGVSARATFRKADLFDTDLSEATVITLFLLPDINLRLRPKILALKPGTRVVSNTFTMAEWEPDERFTVSEGCTTWCTALFWIVPANAAGRWTLADGELMLAQEFQKLSGTLTRGAGTLTIENGTMHGDRIMFTAGGTQYFGRLNGDALEGTGTGGNWKATRAK